MLNITVDCIKDLKTTLWWLEELLRIRKLTGLEEYSINNDDEDGMYSSVFVDAISCKNKNYQKASEYKSSGSSRTNFWYHINAMMRCTQPF